MASDAEVQLVLRVPAIVTSDLIPLTLLRRVLSKVPEELPGLPAPAPAPEGVPAASVQRLLLSEPGIRSRLSLRQRCWLRDTVLQPPAPESGSAAQAKPPNGPSANGPSAVANGAASAAGRRNGEGACSSGPATAVDSPSKLVWMWRVAMPNARSNYWASGFKPLDGYVEFPVEWLGRALALPAASKDELRAVNACRDAFMAAAHYGDTDALALLAKESKQFRQHTLANGGAGRDLILADLTWAFMRGLVERPLLAWMFSGAGASPASASAAASPATPAVPAGAAAGNGGSASSPPGPFADWAAASDVPFLAAAVCHKWAGESEAATEALLDSLAGLGFSFQPSGRTFLAAVRQLAEEGVGEVFVRWLLAKGCPTGPEGWAYVCAVGLEEYGGRAEGELPDLNPRQRKTLDTLEALGAPARAPPGPHSSSAHASPGHGASARDQQQHGQQPQPGSPAHPLHGSNPHLKDAAAHTPPSPRAPRTPTLSPPSSSAPSTSAPAGLSSASPAAPQRKSPLGCFGPCFGGSAAVVDAAVAADLDGGAASPRSGASGATVGAAAGSASAPRSGGGSGVAVASAAAAAGGSSTGGGGGGPVSTALGALLESLPADCLAVGGPSARPGRAFGGLRVLVEQLAVYKTAQAVAEAVAAARSAEAHSAEVIACWERAQDGMERGNNMAAHVDTQRAAAAWEALCLDASAAHHASLAAARSAGTASGGGATSEEDEDDMVVAAEAAEAAAHARKVAEEAGQAAAAQAVNATAPPPHLTRDPATMAALAAQQHQQQFMGGGGGGAGGGGGGQQRTAAFEAASLAAQEATRGMFLGAAVGGGAGGGNRGAAMERMWAAANGDWETAAAGEGPFHHHGHLPAVAGSGSGSGMPADTPEFYGIEGDEGLGVGGPHSGGPGDPNAAGGPGAGELAGGGMGLDHLGGGMGGGGMMGGVVGGVMEEHLGPDGEEAGGGPGMGMGMGMGMGLPMPMGGEYGGGHMGPPQHMGGGGPMGQEYGGPMGGGMAGAYGGVDGGYGTGGPGGHMGGDGGYVGGDGGMYGPGGGGGPGMMGGPPGGGMMMGGGPPGPGMGMGMGMAPVQEMAVPGSAYSGPGSGFGGPGSGYGGGPGSGFGGGPAMDGGGGGPQGVQHYA